MKACPHCGTINAPDKAVCTNCGKSLAAPPPIASPPPSASPAVSEPRPRSASLSLGKSVHEETETRAIPIPLPPSTLEFPAMRREGSSAPPPPSSPPPPPSPSASSPGSALATSRTSRSAEPQASESHEEERDDTPPLNPNHLDTFTAFGEARRIITVIGFGASGKTFLVNRLREALPKSRRWRTFPPKEDRIAITPEGLTLTEVNPVGRGSRRPFVVIDCAGESFQRAFDEQTTSTSLSGVGVRSYLTALACASAYVFVVQAENLAEAASGRQAEKAKVAQLAERFHEIIDGIRLAKLGLAKAEGNAKRFLAQGIARNDFKAIRKASGDPLTEPLFIALSKADRLEGSEPLGFAFDDPLAFAIEGAPDLAAAIETRFARYRYDFVSSFFEHAPPPEDPLRVDYKLPHHGVVEMFDWIERQLGAAPRGQTTWGARLAGDLETRTPLWLRRKVDPSVKLEPTLGSTLGLRR